MNHEQRITNETKSKQYIESGASTFMGRDVLRSLNIGLKEQLYFVTVYDFILEDWI